MGNVLYNLMNVEYLSRYVWLRAAGKTWTINFAPTNQTYGATDSEF